MMTILESFIKKCCSKPKSSTPLRAGYEVAVIGDALPSTPELHSLSYSKSVNVPLTREVTGVCGQRLKPVHLRASLIHSGLF